MTYNINGFGPDDLLTGTKEGFRRIRVDQAQTGFFEGREFRTFAELDIPSGQSLVLRFTSLVDFILFAQNLSVDQGAIRLSAITGGTSGVRGRHCRRSARIACLAAVNTLVAIISHRRQSKAAGR